MSTRDQNVDYRLLVHFQRSRARYEAARRTLPEGWRTGTRPEIQILNDLWVRIIADAQRDQAGMQKPFTRGRSETTRPRPAQGRSPIPEMPDLASLRDTIRAERSIGQTRR